MKKVLIELPTWLGDAVMTTPAIENLTKYFVDIEITLLGSFESIETLKSHPKVIKTYLIDKNYFTIYKIIKDLDEFDFFFSFRGSMRSKIIKFCISSKYKFQFDKSKYTQGHQVEKYNQLINDSLQIKTNPNKLILHNKKSNIEKKYKLLGINPGASYGNAKRWYPQEYAEVAIKLSNQYDIIIFGGPKEKGVAKDIENYLIEKDISNYLNLAGLLSINELISNIAKLDLFITGDSGPMHLAASLQIPTVTIFGPTKVNETSQWKNKNSKIVKKNLKCQPCMKKTCPLVHHNCMKMVKSSDVLKAIDSL
jgi:heptosyltransferase II